MLTLLLSFLAELFITRPPGLEPGTQSRHAQKALAELEGRFFRMQLPRMPDAELGKLKPSRAGRSRTREVAQPSQAAQAVDAALVWSCK